MAKPDLKIKNYIPPPPPASPTYLLSTYYDHHPPGSTNTTPPASIQNPLSPTYPTGNHTRSSPTDQHQPRTNPTKTKTNSDPEKNHGDYHQQQRCKETFPRPRAPGLGGLPRPLARRRNAGCSGADDCERRGGCHFCHGEFVFWFCSASLCLAVPRQAWKWKWKWCCVHIVVTVRFVGGALGSSALREISIVVEVLTVTLRSGFHIKRLAFT